LTELVVTVNTPSMRLDIVRAGKDVPVVAPVVQKATGGILNLFNKAASIV
jgi:hypothetical protein